MKHLLLTIAAALIATAASAQIVSSTSRNITEVQKVKRGWTEFYFQYQAGSLNVDVDGADSQSFSGFKLGWAKAIPVSNSLPLFVRPGIDLGYSSFSLEENLTEDESFDYYSKESTKWAYIDPYCDFGYLYEPSSSISLFPYVGLTARYCVWGQYSYEDEYDSGDFNLFDKDEMTTEFKRFQLGGHIGCDVHLKKFLVGIAYRFDFGEFAEKIKISSFDVKVGLKF